MTFALQRTPSYVSSVPITVSNSTTLTTLVTGSAIVTQYTNNITNVIGDGFIEFSNLAHTVAVTIAVGSTPMVTTFNILGSDIPGGVITTAYHWNLDLRLAPQDGPITTATMKMFGALTITGPSGKLVFDFAESATVNTTILNTFGFSVQWSNAASTNIFTASEIAVAS